MPADKDASSYHDRILTAWMDLLIENSVKKENCPLIAELFVTMHFRCAVDDADLIKKFLRKGIRSQDITDYYQEQSKEIAVEMKNRFRIAKCRQELEHVIDRISDAYHEEKRRSPIGKLKSALDTFRKKGMNE